MKVSNLWERKSKEYRKNKRKDWFDPSVYPLADGKVEIKKHINLIQSTTDTEELDMKYQTLKRKINGKFKRCRKSECRAKLKS